MEASVGFKVGPLYSEGESPSLPNAQEYKHIVCVGNLTLSDFFPNPTRFSIDLPIFLAFTNSKTKLFEF